MVRSSRLSALIRRLGLFKSEKAASPSILEKLPPEVLKCIFLYACTDGGRTARALALTSRHVHALARPSHFHSVRLLSPSRHQVPAFLAQYTSARAQAEAQGTLRPRVQHLLLGTARLSKRLPRPSCCVAAAGQLHSCAAKRNPTLRALLIAEQCEAEQSEYRAAVSALVRLLAPELVSLALAVVHTNPDVDVDARESPYIAWHPIAPLPQFGALRTLTLLGYPYRILCAPPPGGEGWYPLFPRLERVHDVRAGRVVSLGTAAGGGDGGGRVSMKGELRYWAQNAPGLRVLRVSNLGYLALDTGDALGRAFGVWYPSWGARDEAESLPSGPLAGIGNDESFAHLERIELEMQNLQGILIDSLIGLASTLRVPTTVEIRTEGAWGWQDIVVEGWLDTVVALTEY